MANTDFRVKLGFQDHIKTIKLRNRLGPESVLCLLRVWDYTAMNKPMGILDREEIEVAARWTGEAGKFLETTLELKFLDDVDEAHVAIHDWEEHNQWAFKASERSEHARMMAAIKWEKQRKKERKKDDASGNAVSNASGNAPSPSSPSPSSPHPSSPDLGEPPTSPEPEKASPNTAEENTIDKLRNVFDGRYTDDDLHPLAQTVEEKNIPLSLVQKYYEQAEGSTSLGTDPGSILDRVLQGF